MTYYKVGNLIKTTTFNREIQGHNNGSNSDTFLAVGIYLTSFM